jgi:hypothetical protein
MGVARKGRKQREAFIMMSTSELNRLVELSMALATSMALTGAAHERMGGHLTAEEVSEWELLMKEAGLDPYGNDNPED